MVKLYVMVGCPAAGKSTWINSHKQKDEVWVSRDKVRYSLLEDNDSYFAKEKLVFETFVENIKNLLAEGITVYADATHLTKASRRKLLYNCLPESRPEEINAIFIKESLDTCLDRNSKREGLALVPESALKDMYAAIEPPSLEEGFNKIYIIEEGMAIQIRSEYE